MSDSPGRGGRKPTALPDYSGRGIFALLSLATSALLAWLFVGSAIGQDWWVLIPAATIASGATGWVLWTVSAQRGALSERAGALTGALTGALSHPVMWYLSALGDRACFELTGSCTDSFGRPTPVGLSGVLVALGASLVSVLWVGWITVPVGAAAGWLSVVLGRVASRRRSPPGSGSAPA